MTTISVSADAAPVLGVVYGPDALMYPWLYTLHTQGWGGEPEALAVWGWWTLDATPVAPGLSVAGDAAATLLVTGALADTLGIVSTDGPTLILGGC